MEEDYEGSDEELAPMVDGLSGTLCIIILVSMVFIFSGLKTANTYINYGQLKFENIKLDISKKIIYFKGGIHFTESEIDLLTNEFKNSSRITLYGYTDEKISNNQEKNAYNLLYVSSLIKKLDSNKKIVLKKGTKEYCPDWNSCIYWDYN